MEEAASYAGGVSHYRGIARKVGLGYSKTLQSWHVPQTAAMLPHNGDSFDVVHGNAADIVDERYWWSDPAASRSFKFWLDLGRIAKKHGCRWDGDWKHFPDVTHVEFWFIESPPATSALA